MYQTSVIHKIINFPSVRQKYHVYSFVLPHPRGSSEPLRRALLIQLLPSIFYNMKPLLIEKNVDSFSLRTVFPDAIKLQYILYRNRWFVDDILLPWRRDNNERKSKAWLSPIHTEKKHNNQNHKERLRNVRIMWREEWIESNASWPMVMTWFH